MKLSAFAMCCALATAILTLAAGSQALAGNTWDGGGSDNNWSTGSNWNDNLKPASDGTVTIHMAGTVRPTPNVDVAWNIAGLIFDSGAAPFTLSGSTLTISGDVRNLDTNLQTVSNFITLGAPLHFDAYAGDLALGGTINNTGNILTVCGSHNTTISGVISNGGLTKSEAGTLTLSGAARNTYAGMTTVNGGTLELAKSGGWEALYGNLTINAGTVRYLANNQCRSLFTSVTFASAGVLDLNGYSDALLNLNMAGGSVITGAGTLYLGGAVTTSASAAAATISGNLSLNNGTRSFDVAEGDAATDLDIPAVISQGGLTKAGAGTMRLSGASSNTCAGMTTVNGGTLELAKSGGSAAFYGDLTVNGGTVRYLANNQCRALAASVTVASVGALDFNGYTDTLLNLTLTGGSVTTGGGTLYLRGTFSQSGGTFAGTLHNQGTFSYAAGTFSGRLINEGVISLSAPFTAGNGIQNFSTLSLAADQTITSNGDGLDNEGIITLSGSTLNGAANMVNNAIIFGYGTVGGTDGSFTNNGQVALSGGNLTLANTLANSNAGNIDLAPGLQLRLTGAALNNTGTLDLGGGAVAGIASLINQGGGTVAGRGAIMAPFSNAGGTLRPVGGTINVTRAFTNTGVVRLEGGAGLAGGAITNAGAGTIQGDGTVANSVSNSARIEATSGMLSLGGALTNTVDGTIAAGAGAKVLVTSGLAANAGIISLAGGTFDNGGVALDNTGQISGRGTLLTGGLANHGGIGFSGGTSDVYGDVTNPAGGRITVTGGATATFYDDVVHDSGATFQVSAGSSVVLFGLSGTGSFSGTGTVYMEGDLRPGHSPAVVTFEGDLIMGSGATLVAELAGTAPGSQYDVIDVGGSLALGGTLDVDLLYGFAPHAGETFDILNFDPANLSGEFDAIALPDLGGGLSWDTSNLYTTGAIGIVPEPATLALMAVGVLAIVRRGRRWE